MAAYDTWTKTKNDITVTVSKKANATAGEKLTAFLKWLADNVVDPGYGQGGGKPDQGLPGKPPGTATQPKPDNTLPGKPPGTATQPHPDQGLPGAPVKPDQGLPGSQPEVDNELPETIGEHADEIAKLILGKCFDCVDGAQPKK